MVETMEKILLGRVLEPPSRKLLLDWLLGVRTGARRIRAGLPANWRAGDKTGTGEDMAINDVAIAWPPQREPILMAIYTSSSAQAMAAVEAAHAELAALIATTLGPPR
jgi:beta-lactamase class A